MERRCAYNAMRSLAPDAVKSLGLSRCTNGAVNIIRCGLSRRASKIPCSTQTSSSIANVANSTIESRKSAKNELVDIVVEVRVVLVEEEVAPVVGAIPNTVKEEEKVDLQDQIGSRSRAAVVTSIPVAVGPATKNTV